MGTNTGIGIGIGIPFKNNALGGDRPYLPPELKARLIGVWDNYGKKNTDADRNIIKNKIPNAGGDLEILNAAYKLNSGFGEYKEDFTSWRIYPNIEVTDNVITTNGNFNSSWFIYKHANENEINEMNIKVSGIPEGGIIRYFYIPDETATIPVSYNISEDGVHHLPKSKLSSNRVSVGFTVSSSYDWNNIRIEQLSDFGGAFVTDGVNDMIISQKTIAEMGITDEVTIVSMIHQITLNSTYNLATTNYIENSTTKEHVRTDVYAAGKTGIYGYTASLINSTRSTIGYILGDIRDYQAVGTTNKQTILDSKFSVVGRVGGFTELSSVAHYWTFAVLGIATEDEINLIIAKYNLDRTLRSDILCNITKQGITNDNHADFNDKLIDYSGNGRDIQMYNLLWKGGSGIGASDKRPPFLKPVNFSIPGWNTEANEVRVNYEPIDYGVKITKIKTDGTALFWVSAPNHIDNIAWYKVSGVSTGKGIRFGAETRNSTWTVIAETDGIYKVDWTNLVDSTGNRTLPCILSNGWIGDCNIIIEQIDPCLNGLCLDGITDFGKVIGMPIYKDYTFIIDRQIITNDASGGIVASKSESAGDVTKQGAFIFEYLNTNAISTWSYYKNNSLVANSDSNRNISYQSKYSYNGKALEIGKGKDSDKLWIGTIRDNDERFANIAIYSLMSFPYSMSEFLIERQLKKHKLGTLYPDMVEFRPVIKANANYNIFYTALLPLTGIVWEKINIGDYIPVGRRVAIQLSFDNEASELVSAISSQLGNISITKNSNNKGYTIFGDILKNKSPQKINITIDEYIRYEDIVQPYPVIFQITDRNTNQRYSWGDKIKVGSSIRLSQGEKPNLLSGLYSIQSYEYEGETYSYNQLTNLNIILTKQSISLSCNKTWLLDDNEPKCILSPRLLRIPNSSYKILGYIPDISGHGNHGVIHNSAYAEGSGVNEDGSYQFDGVDDFITIPTTVGGKQVLMKVNWQSIAGTAILYDQRTNGGFAIFNRDFDTNENKVPAYRARNIGGSTYIDGILNEYIYASELKDITHNIVELCDPELNTGTLNPKIGSSFLNSNYTQMSLYDFMLFDEISTDDKIKELNTYIGITPKVTLPNYYWDNYGKKNTDANRGYVDEQVSLQKTGTSVNPLENFNISYEGMSGYNGYPVVFGASKTWESLSGVYGYTSNVTSTTIHVTHAEHAGNSLLFSYVKKDGALVNIKEIPAFRVTIGGLEGNSKFGYRYLATEDATEETLVYLGNGTHELAKSFAPTEALLDLTRNVWVGIFITPMIEGEVVFDCDITIEVLPEYENGLAYDGVSDFSQNTEIEVVEDFTFLVKGSLLKGLTGSGGCIARKGDKKHYDTGGYAFIYCFDSPIESYRNSYYSFGKSFVPSKEIVAPPLIGYMTKTNVNGETTTFGTNSDIKGIIFGNWSTRYMNMVIYKSIFYTKTISLLEINFLKNLMEKDEIIDINHPIFISNTEDESNTSQDT